MEYEPVCTLMFFILPALPEVLHDPVVSNPGFGTRLAPKAAGSEPAAQNTTRITAFTNFMRGQEAKLHF
jgi:hypothetical protein